MPGAEANWWLSPSYASRTENSFLVRSDLDARFADVASPDIFRVTHVASFDSVDQQVVFSIHNPHPIRGSQRDERTAMMLGGVPQSQYLLRKDPIPQVHGYPQARRLTDVARGRVAPSFGAIIAQHSRSSLSTLAVEHFPFG